MSSDATSAKQSTAKRVRSEGGCDTTTSSNTTANVPNCKKAKVGSSLQAILQFDSEDFQKDTLECDDETLVQLERSLESLATTFARAKFQRAKQAQNLLLKQKAEKMEKIYHDNSGGGSAETTEESMIIPAEAVRPIAKFLNLKDKGNFLLKTSKKIVQDLGYNTVWKEIFETIWGTFPTFEGSFNDVFETMIKERGYAWMFQQLFQKQPALDAAEPHRQSTSLSSQVSRTPALTEDNTFLLFCLTTNSKDGHVQVFHSIILTKENLGCMAEGPAKFELELPQSAADIAKNNRHLLLRVYAFRLDTHECCLLVAPTQYQHMNDGTIQIGDPSHGLVLGGYCDATDHFPLNQEGRHLLERMIGSAPDGKCELNFQVEIEPACRKIEFSLLFLEYGYNTTAVNYWKPNNGVSLFQILDYGIHWNPVF